MDDLDFFIFLKHLMEKNLACTTAGKTIRFILLIPQQVFPVITRFIY